MKNYISLPAQMVVVAQLVRASVCGTEGRGFEPHLPPKKVKALRNQGLFFVYSAPRVVPLAIRPSRSSLRLHMLTHFPLSFWTSRPSHSLHMLTHFPLSFWTSRPSHSLHMLTHVLIFGTFETKINRPYY